MEKETCCTAKLDSCIQCCFTGQRRRFQRLRLAMADQLYFDIRYSAGAITAVADGALNFFTSPELKKKLAAWIEPGVTAITIDLKNVPHVDSAGIAALIHASKTCTEREIVFRLLNAPTAVKTIFAKSGLSALLPQSP